MKKTPVSDSILAMVKRPEGFRPTEDWKQTGGSKQGVERAINRLWKQGDAHPARISAKYVRYFGTAKEALDYMALNARPTVPAPVYARVSTEWKTAPEDRSKAKTTIAEKTRSRWDPESTYTPMFSALKPGQYL